MRSCRAPDVELSLTKAKRFVALVAAWADELDHIGHECGHANANDLHRSGIDELSAALEPKAVAVSVEIRVRLFALGQLAPHARESLLYIGLDARGVFERRIEDRFHVKLLANVVVRPPATSRRCGCGDE